MSKNITIDNLGQITIQLGEFFSFPDNFMKLFNNGDSEIKSVFKMGLETDQFLKVKYTVEMVSYIAPKILGIKRRKKIPERSVKELAGFSFEEFIDSNRYENTIKWRPHILIFKMIFENPWKVSFNYTDVLKIKFCKQDFHPDLI